MTHLGVLKPDTFIRLVNLIGVPMSAIYFLSMFLYPWTAGDWGYVQEVWDRWQSLNVGVLAFVSSIIAFNISRYNAGKQRERDFLAAKAFLPSVLSDLSDYLHASAAVFRRGWEVRRGEDLGITAPPLPESYKDIFARCISHAVPEVGDYLARLLMRLQVHHSRMTEFVVQFADPEWINPDRGNLISYFYRLGELRVLVNRLFPVARNEEVLNRSDLTWDEFKNAYGNLDLWSDEYRVDDRLNLEGFTKRRIESGLGGLNA